jgi:N-acetylneuraminic acid mutarotase
MPAGRIVTSGNVSAMVSPDGDATRSLTLTNTGDRTATFVVDQFPGSGSGTGSGSHTGAATTSSAMASAAAPAAAPRTVPVTNGTDKTLVQRLVAEKKGGSAGPAITGAATAPSSAPAWSALPDAPAATYEGVAASYDGLLYEGLGANGSFDDSNALYSYNPATGTWTTEASAPIAVGEAGYAVIGDDLYVTGGVSGDFPDLYVETTTQVYDFATNTWSEVAPDPYTFSGTDVALDGELYQIGGEDPTTYGGSDIVSVYDPSTNTWSETTSYPSGDITQACGVIGGTVYCAGGSDDDGNPIADAYAYTPGDTSWSQIDSLPISLSGAAFSVADGELLVSGGVTGDDAALTTAGYKYDPAQNWWVPIPAAPAAEMGAAGVTGFYTFGGVTEAAVTADADVLSGYGQTDPVSLPWLSLSETTVTLRPGQQATITIRLNAAGSGLNGRGTVSAALGFETDTPYEVTPVAVSLTVQ